MDRGIIKSRIGAVRRRLNEHKINCLIVTNRANVTYISGFSGDDSYAVIAPRGVYLVTDSRYTEQARNECCDCRIIERAGPMAEQIAKVIGRLKSVGAAAVEKSISLAGFGALKKNFTGRLKPVGGIIENVRSLKDAEEIVSIRAAASIASQAFRRTAKYIKPGVTENELAGVLDFQIRKSGAVNCFDTIVAFGPNASMPHHRPGPAKLKRNDTILIDFGVRYNNYCCDLSRCLVVGRCSGFYRQLCRAVREAQAAAIKMVKAGVEIRKIDSVARDVISRHKLPVYGHGTGHGLGLEVHEKPLISAGARGRLRAGMVFTIEPGVYIPGKASVRIEDDILVTESGYEILSDGCAQLALPAARGVKELI